MVAKGEQEHSLTILACPDPLSAPATGFFRRIEGYLDERAEFHLDMPQKVFDILFLPPPFFGA